MTTYDKFFRAWCWVTVVISVTASLLAFSMVIAWLAKDRIQ